MSRRHRSRRRSPPSPATAILAVLRALPRLGAEIALVTAANPRARVELLPGVPCTVAFTVEGELRGLILAPGGEQQVRRALGLGRPQQIDPSTARLWELDRRDPGLDDAELPS
jgi:hypothetical protein